MSIRLEDGRWGLRAVATSAWSPETTRYLIARDVRDLELNHAKGWQGADISFLSELPSLRAFKIIDLRISSVEPVHSLHELRALEVVTYCKTAIRFQEFPHLEDCGLEWRPKCESLFSAITLTKLFLNCYKKHDVDALSGLVNLQSLAILTSPIKNLHGLRPLKRLKYLRLGNLRRLTSLAGIEGLSNLEELNVDTCRSIGSVNELSSLSQLQKLHLGNCGEIESLKPLENLERLKWVTFVESTNIRDGDISPLLRRKVLSRVSFQNRRHYSHRREDFGAAYFGEEYAKHVNVGGKRLSRKEMVEIALGRASRSR